VTQSPSETLPPPPVLKSVPSDPAPAPTPLPGPAVRAARARARAALQAQAQPAPAPRAPTPIPPPAPRVDLARARPRHWGLLASFLLLVLLPTVASTAYLYRRAADQYHSTTAFSIRSEEMSVAAAGLLGAITQLGSGTASDVNILFDFIRSQAIVETIDDKLDLRRIFNRAPDDVVFALGEDASIEDLLAYWRRMVTVDIANDGIIAVRANAFTPGDAHAITEEILAESSALVNRLADQARRDAVSFAKAELTVAENRLRDVRRELADFRREHRIVDPSGDVAGQMGIVNALQGELARAMVERDMLLTYAEPADQRVVQADRRIEATAARIEAERDAMGNETNALPEVVGAYEALRVDLEIATTAHTHALAGYAASEAEARRQSRYLAPHVRPTQAEEALYPRRFTLAAMTGLFLLLGWGILMLVYYNVRDNNR
jgi:capsular polysaccharide transport system permease protein